VEKGTFEALVHESVFATTFSKATAGDASEEAEADQDQYLVQWRDFASAILLSLPTLVGPTKFENEFTRCCAYLVSGAGEDTKGNVLARVMWLAGEYVRGHGGPTDLSEWEQWRSETIHTSPLMSPTNPVLVVSPLRRRCRRSTHERQTLPPIIRRSLQIWDVLSTARC